MKHQKTILLFAVLAISLLGTVKGQDVLNHIAISPYAVTLNAGDQQIFVAIAYDEYNNSLGIVTAQTSWSVPVAAGGSWIQKTGTYTSQNPGKWTVTAIYDGFKATAALTVNPRTTTPPPSSSPSPSSSSSSPTSSPSQATVTPTASSTLNSNPTPTPPLYIPPTTTPNPTFPLDTSKPTLNPADQMLSTAFSKPAPLVLICVFAVAFLGALAIVSRVRRTRKLKM